MKYIKKFEIINSEPESGDYILANFKFNNIIWSNYIANNIGIFIQKKMLDFELRYVTKYYIDDEIYNTYFKGYKERKKLLSIENDKRYINVHLKKEEIIAFSKDKKDIEKLIAANKYNL